MSLSGWDRNRSRSIPFYILPDVNTTILEPSTLCRDESTILLLIVICSAAENFEIRYKSNQINDLHVFFLSKNGNTKNNNHKKQFIKCANYLGKHYVKHGQTQPNSIIPNFQRFIRASKENIYLLIMPIGEISL